MGYPYPFKNKISCGGERGQLLNKKAPEERMRNLRGKTNKEDAY